MSSTGPTPRRPSSSKKKTTYGTLEVDKTGTGAAAVSASPSFRNLPKRDPSRRLPPRFASKRASLLNRNQSKRRNLNNAAQNAEQGAVLPALLRQSTIVESERHDHTFLYTLLNPRSKNWQSVIFKKFISVVILVDLIFFVISTEPDWTDSPIFRYVEGTTSTIFLIEYVARFMVCCERRKYGKYGWFLGRLRYMISWPALVDALATFPFFLERYTGIPLPTLTYLRVFRLLRILKTEGYARAMDAVVRVIFYNREILTVAGLLCVFLVIFTAVLMYYLRPQGKDKVDSTDENFNSMAGTMYLSMLMLTGQGGPDGDLPWYTKGVVLLAGVFSVPMFAIPASMLTWGFEAEAARLAARARKRRKRVAAGLSASSSSSDGDDDDDWDESSSVDTSDEEYQKIIAGEEEEGDGASESAESKRLRELMETFNSADTDGSGSLTKEEFMKLSMASLQSGRGEEYSSLLSRVENLENKLDDTNEKLDRLLQHLTGK